MTDHSVNPLPMAHGHGSCSCGGVNGTEDPVIDARTIPHAIRHAAIFGALDSIAPGNALVLIAPHDPLPLLAQARDRYPAGVGVEYLESGPDAWRIRLQRD
jgi:uncharacterized protein (DUF2249 family)